MNRKMFSGLIRLMILVATCLAMAEVTMLPALAKTWSLENTPKEFRPGLCASVRKQLAYELGTQSYKTALGRKAEGRMWRKHEKRIADVEGVKDAYRRLNCKAYT